MIKDLDNISCDDIRRHISEYIDHNLPDDLMDAFDGHLSSCSDCAREVDLLMATAAAAAEAVRIPPASLYRSVMQKVRRQELMKRFIKTGGAVAAAAFVLVAMIYARPIIGNYNSNADNGADELIKSSLCLPYYTSKNPANHQEQTAGYSEDNQAHEREDNFADDPSSDLLAKAIGDYSEKKANVKVIYISVRSDDFAALCAKVDEASVLYLDDSCIAFEYSEKIDVPTVVTPLGNRANPTVVVACIIG